MYRKGVQMKKFFNYYLFAMIFLYMYSPINEPSHLLHTGKGEHDSFDAASICRSWERVEGRHIFIQI